MFEKVFIANRGEIACWASRPLRELGIETVVVHIEQKPISFCPRYYEE